MTWGHTVSSTEGVLHNTSQAASESRCKFLSPGEREREAILQQGPGEGPHLQACDPAQREQLSHSPAIGCCWFRGMPFSPHISVDCLSLLSGCVTAKVIQGEFKAEGLFTKR